MDTPANLLLLSLQEFFSLLAKRYNSTVSDELMHMSVRSIGEAEDGDQQRLLITTSQWALSIRCRAKLVECFILPATELMNLPESELPSRNKLTLKVHDIEHGAWTFNDVIVTGDEMNALMRGLFKDVVSRTRSDIDGMPEPLRLIAGGYSFAGAIKSLVDEKHALVQKIVDQQEAILGSVARDLHDVILGNVMLMRRSLSGGNPLPAEEMTQILDEISANIREVCQNLSPRDLKDLGLRPLLEELCLTFARRTGYPCKFICPNQLPDFPTEVALHLYRIAQECLNNTAKYASASEVSLKIELAHEMLTMVVSDNGIGYDTAVQINRLKAGGTGFGIIRERAELINYVYPARIWLDSKVNAGTRITLEISLQEVESRETEITTDWS